MRRGFEHPLHADIAWRSELEFAEGCGSEQVMRDHGNRVVTDADFAGAGELFLAASPTSKEAFLYRRILEQTFTGEAPRPTVERWHGEAPAAA